MAWVSPKVYAILSSSEEGKDIIERLPDMTQDECQEELDSFFGDGGKGSSSGEEYGQAKMDDKAEEERYKAIGNEEVSPKDYDGEEYKVGDKVKVQGKEYTITKIEEDGHFEAKGENGTFGSGNLKDKTVFGGNPISIEKIKEDYSLEDKESNENPNEPKKLDDIIKEHNTFTKDKDYDAYSFKKELEENGHKVEYIENRSGTWQDHNGEKFKEYDIKLEGGQHIYFKLIADENYDTKEIIVYKNGKNW